MLLPDLHPQEQHVFTLVLDLNETLLYSDWKVYNTFYYCFRTFTLFFNVMGVICLHFSFLSCMYLKRDRGWRTFKRPGVDDFLEHLAQYYEIVVYSDQQAMVILFYCSLSYFGVVLFTISGFCLFAVCRSYC